MKKFTLLLLSSILGISSMLSRQASKDSTTVSDYEHARHKNGDIKEVLGENCLYPREALLNQTQGDVVLSFTISKEGKMENPGVISFSDVNLCNCSMKALNSIDNEWVPCMENGKAIDRNYLIVFRYRFYMNSLPPDPGERAEKLFNKGKYEKALKLYDRAIEDNKYDQWLYLSRSKVKGRLGDDKGSAMDLAESEKLKNSVLTIMDILTIGEIRTKTRVERTTIRRRY